MSHDTGEPLRDAPADALQLRPRRVGDTCSNCEDDIRRLLLAAAEQSEQLDAREEMRIIQLAAISTASIQNTPDSRKDRITQDHPYWSVAYSDVCVAIDREIALREQMQTLLAENDIRKVKND